MLRSLYTAGTGMVAQQHNLDVIANNLANVNTTGFKQQRAEFEDLMYQTMRAAGVAEGSGSAAPENMQIGLGVKIAGTSSNFRVGSLQNTGNALNLAISGSGFFKLSRPDGTAVYTRDGSFQPDATGKLVSMDGLALDPEVQVPQGSTSINVSAEGDVSAVAPGETSSKVFGKIQVSNVANPAGMSRLGGNLFAATEAAGDIQSGTPGENGTGTLLSGYLEGSNVEVVEEMTRMITAQRAYEINSKAIQTADDMLGIVNNLKR
jgi:flagellar basal-body rod protein FlgG